jgi:hypothetical protein
MSYDLGFDEISLVIFEVGEGALVVGRHHAAVADDIGEYNGGQSAFTRLRHQHLPQLHCRYHVFAAVAVSRAGGSIHPSAEIFLFLRYEGNVYRLAPEEENQEGGAQQGLILLINLST